MRNYLIKRILSSIIIDWGLLTVTFILLRVGPSSPVDRYILNIAARGQDVESVKQAIEARYGRARVVAAIRALEGFRR